MKAFTGKQLFDSFTALDRGMRAIDSVAKHGLGHVKECHRPSNEDCPHNADPRFDCACKSGKVVVRKPYREIRVCDASVKMHRISGNIVCHIYDNGLLGMREKGKRRRYETTIGAVYTGRVWSEAMAKAREKKAMRKGARK